MRKTTRMRMIGVAGAAVCAAIAAPSAGAAAEPVTASQAPGAQPAPVENLYNPGTLSYFSFVKRATVAHKQPDLDSGEVGRLGLKTEDRTDELVLVLERTLGPGGETWYHVRLPIRPVGSTGWVPASALEKLEPVRTHLIVDTRRYRATLIKNGKAVFRARVGVGQSRWPTPRAEGYMRNELRGFGGKGSIYGPVAMGTSIKSEVLTDWPGGGVVGIHGTNRPEIIRRGRISHGCVRMTNRNILKLARLVEVGTPLSIR